MLIKLDKRCKKCGRDISNQEYEEHNGYCVICKEKLVSNKKPRIKKREKNKILCIIIGIIILIMFSVYGYITYMYKLGEKNYKESKYEKAIDYFEKVSIYKDSKEKLAEIYYLRGVEEREKENFFLAILCFMNSKNYKVTEEQIKDVEEQIIETKYQYAIYKYNNGELNEAKELFEEVQDDKDVKEYIKNIDIMSQVQGVWRCDGASSIINIKDNILESFSCFGTGKGSVYKYKFDNIKFFKVESKGGHIKIEENKIKIIENDGEYYEWDEEGKNIICTISKSIPPLIYTKSDKEITRIKEPSIGMTKNEIKESTWGSPEKINKTTTSYGVHEQWCYSNYKYIYFENGVVTSIQE